MAAVQGEDARLFSLELVGSNPPCRTNKILKNLLTMEITLSKRDRDAIVHDLRVALLQDIKKMMLNEQPPEMVTTEEAAKILGIGPKRMRDIADRYPHIKRGDTPQSPLLFLRSALIPQ